MLPETQVTVNSSGFLPQQLQFVGIKIHEQAWPVVATAYKN